MPSLIDIYATAGMGKYCFVGKRGKHLLIKTTLSKASIDTGYKCFGKRPIFPGICGRNLI